MSQLELWNDSPEPWQRRMEREAFAIAFPLEALNPGDTVEIQTTWVDAQESWGCGEGTCYEEGNDSNLIIRVVWHRKWHDPRAGEPGTRVYWFILDPPPVSQTYTGQEAVDFWMRLMRGGSD